MRVNREGEAHSWEGSRLKKKRPPQQGLELGSDRLQGIFLRHEVSVRTAQVAHQDHRFGAVVQAVFDAGNCRLDPETSANPGVKLLTFVCENKRLSEQRRNKSYFNWVDVTSGCL